jgi:hypothetical protein
MYLRSGYEFTVATKLDSLNEYYEYEKIRIQYQLSGETHIYVSDFYLPKYNLILEPKNDYFFKIRNDKYKEQYLASIKAGYNIHFLFESDIKNFKNTTTVAEYYQAIKDRTYFK